MSARSSFAIWRYSGIGPYLSSGRDIRSSDRTSAGSGRERVARKAAARVLLVDEDAGPHARILVHDPVRLLLVAGEDPDPAHVGAVSHRADDREVTVRPEREVAPPVLPHD